MFLNSASSANIRAVMFLTREYNGSDGKLPFGWSATSHASSFLRSRTCSRAACSLWGRIESSSSIWNNKHKHRLALLHHWDTEPDEIEEKREKLQPSSTVPVAGNDCCRGRPPGPEREQRTQWCHFLQHWPSQPVPPSQLLWRGQRSGLPAWTGSAQREIFECVRLWSICKCIYRILTPRPRLYWPRFLPTWGVTLKRSQVKQLKIALEIFSGYIPNSILPYRLIYFSSM